MRSFDARNYANGCGRFAEEEFGGLGRELDELLSIAATAEARRGLSLADLGQSLRTQFNATRETHPSPRTQYN